MNSNHPGVWLRTVNALFTSSAQTPVCCHHRRLLSHPLQHGGREEDLPRTGSREVRDSSTRA